MADLSDLIGILIYLLIFIFFTAAWRKKKKSGAAVQRKTATPPGSLQPRIRPLPVKERTGKTRQPVLVKEDDFFDIFRTPPKTGDSFEGEESEYGQSQTGKALVTESRGNMPAESAQITLASESRLQTAGAPLIYQKKMMPHYFKNREDLRKAIISLEILGKPRAINPF